MIEQLREKSNKLPLVPGVYIMKDSAGDVIYVGKAKALKNRVSSYFRGEHEAKTAAMVSKVCDFDVIMCSSEFEALVLENSLIKHHMPKYNILLRDDKGYPFIRVDTKSEYPVFSIVSRVGSDGAAYFGPYGGRTVTRGAINTVCKTLKLPTCSRKFPRDIGKERPCLNYHMGNCIGVCRPETAYETYRDSINSALDMLDGKAAAVTKKLASKMEAAAEALLFEEAASARDMLKAIKLLEGKQLVIAGAKADTDVIGFFRGTAKSCFVALHYIGGSLLDKDYELFDTPLEDDSGALSGLLRLYYQKRGVLPRNICLPSSVEDSELLERLFTENSGHRVTVLTPERGEKRQLVETANINAREETERFTSAFEKTQKSMEWLAKALGLEKAPERFEAFDISNTGSSDIVASMTVFYKGKPYKKDYRRFKIKTLETQDDYHSMAEVVSRRIKRYVDGDEKFGVLPDVMLIDGGQAHANAALGVLNAAGVAVPVFGMVKDDRHRTRALITPTGEEIGIIANPAVFAFIGTIQEETHRFAIDFHHQTHTKHSIGSELDKIDGVGKARRQALLKHFGSIKKIKAATADELQAVVPRATALKIVEYFTQKPSA